MANDVFSIADDVEISIFTYSTSAAIWNVTRWDNGDLWSSGSETEAWQAITCSVVAVDTDNGFTVEQGLIRPEPATARIVFTNAEYDPFINSNVRSGTPVRVRVRPNPDTAPSTWVTLFEGKIDTATAAYNYQWVNTVTLDCVTDLRDYLNFTSESGLVTASPCYAVDYLDAMNTAYGSAIAVGSSAPPLVGYELEGINSIDPVPFGEIINQLLDSNLAALVYLPVAGFSNNYLYNLAELVNRDLDPAVIFEAAPSAEPKRAEFSDIVIGFDTAEVVNTVNYDTTLGYANSRTNSDSVALLGNISVDVTTLHWNDADADDWANNLALRLPERRVQAVTAPVILRAGQVNENLLRDPIDAAKVSVSNSQISIEETYLISRVMHAITPNSWDTTLNLWSGN